jgi:hypothetical protein
MFSQIFVLDQEIEQPLPPKLQGHNVLAGRYDGGLLSVLDAEISDRALSGWRWLVGSDAQALVISSIGDLFFWSEKHSGIYFLGAQVGKPTFVDSEIDYLLNEFLPKNGVREDVLHQTLCENLTKRIGPPNYGDCFIPEPWIIAGGSGHESTYGVGKLDVYLNLVGQTFQRNFKR